MITGLRCRLLVLCPMRRNRHGDWTFKGFMPVRRSLPISSGNFVSTFNFDENEHKKVIAELPSAVKDKKGRL